MSSADTLVDVREKLARGETQDAYRALLSVFRVGGPEPLAETATFKDACSLLSDISRTFGAVPLAEKIQKCARNPEDPQALYDAAYALYEEQQFSPAATLLFRANRLAPGQVTIVTELCGCLEGLLQYGLAALSVDSSGLPERDPFCAYLSGYCWLMTGDLEAARRRAAALAGCNEEDLPFMRDALLGMLARADALRAAGITLDERSLTAWQAVINGTLLLHESPAGYEEPMHGRYAFVSDTEGLMNEGLSRLRTVLDACGEKPRRVVAAPDRASRILARAAAASFGVPCVDWEHAGGASGLVVVWILENVEDTSFLEALRAHGSEQRLFVHASCWTEPFGYAPDVTTLLYQTITNPFTGGALLIDPKTRSISHAEPDTRSDDVLAKSIETASSYEPSRSSVEQLVAIVRALSTVPEPHRAGLHRVTGNRLIQRAGGPVPSNRF